MRLKLLSPFTIDGFDILASRVLQSPRDYEKAWGDAVEELNSDLSNVPDLDQEIVKACRFTHTSNFCERVGSRYRTIDTHSLPRPLHAMEFEVEISSSQWRSIFKGRRHAVENSPRDGKTRDLFAIADSLEESLTEQSPPALIRVYDHHIALLEIDLPVPAMIEERVRDQSIGDYQNALDALQQLGIEVAESLVDEIHHVVLNPMFAWLRQREGLHGRFVWDSVSNARRARSKTDSRALWVTRSLVFEKSDSFDSTENGDNTRCRLIRHWLKDVASKRAAVEACCNNDDAHSTAWLNYLFRENACGEMGYPPVGWARLEVARATDATNECAQTNKSATHSKRSSGSKVDTTGRARPFCPTWDAMVIAQYYYAAFDHLQSNISRILAIAVAGERRRKVSDVKNLLDDALRDANMLKLEYDENRKYYAHKVASQVDEILEGWAFKDGLRAQIDKRLEDCESRLNELHSRALERSSIYTDLILLAIGITAVFEVLLYLAEYGRTMTADPDLSVYDRTSWNIVSWIGASSTDAILLSGAVFSVGLTLLYAYFRSSKSRV